MAISIVPSVSSFYLFMPTHTYTHSSSLPSGHLQRGCNPSEWWEYWAGTYQRCQYDQQHPTPSTHTKICQYMGAVMGVYKGKKSVSMCVLYACCHDQFLLERWKADFLSHLVCLPMVHCVHACACVATIARCVCAKYISLICVSVYILCVCMQMLKHSSIYWHCIFVCVCVTIFLHTSVSYKSNIAEFPTDKLSHQPPNCFAWLF